MTLNDRCFLNVWSVVVSRVTDTQIARRPDVAEHGVFGELDAECLRQVLGRVLLDEEHLQDAVDEQVSGSRPTDATRTDSGAG